MEGSALFLVRDIANYFVVACKDVYRVGEIIELAGHMMLAGLRTARGQGQLKATGPMPDPGLVLALIVIYVWELRECGADPGANCSWLFVRLGLADVASMPGHDEGAPGPGAGDAEAGSQHPVGVERDSGPDEVIRGKAARSERPQMRYQ
ncbi:hypothetical protein CDD83_6726 [Cordyceps sp. RAO-2017]|nr:hypothetical protein CDD83_6726 [Cordyceps sp. RAO-2017]